VELTSDRAFAYELALRWGYLSRHELISQVENYIAKTEGLPSSDLCELAVCSNDDEVFQLLLDIRERQTPVNASALKIFLTEVRTLESFTEGEELRLIRRLVDFFSPANSDEVFEDFWADFVDFAYGHPQVDKLKARQDFHNFMKTKVLD